MGWTTTCCAVAGLALAATAPAGEAGPPASEVALPEVELPEIVVNVLAEPAPFTSLQVGAPAVRELDATASSELVRAVPGARVQTNSRGETLVYMRNAGERQVAVFLEGALLNVPWDNRIDLSMVPAPMVGSISAVQGVAPVEFGANVIGGALNLVSPSWRGSGTLNAEVQAGTEARAQGTASYLGGTGPWSLAAGASYGSIAGLALPAGADLPFGQENPWIRTNTDSRMASLSGRAGLSLPGGESLSLSAFWVDAEKGIAPEGHKDPAVSRVRFWRYPVWRNAMGILGGQGALGEGGEWRATAWVNGFTQTIEAFTSATYDVHDAREIDHDLTLGARGVAQVATGPSTFKVAFNGLVSWHDQQDLDLEPDGQPVPGRDFPVLHYAQSTLSGGAEWGWRPAATFLLVLGGNVDAMLPFATGDKPAAGPFVTWGASLGGTWSLAGGWRVRASAGRKARFPTLRELFGEALGQFLVNSELRPEAAIIAEVGGGLDSGAFGFEVVPFGMFTQDAIEQRTVRIPGESRPRRQRVNLEGSRILGVQLTATAAPLLDLSLDAALTWSSARRIPENEGDPTWLAEKPEWVGRLVGRWAPALGPSGLVELVFTAGSWSLGEGDAWVALPASAILNLRAGYRFAVPGDGSLEIFARVNNVADALEVQQLGLPSAGRTVEGGLVAAF